MRRAAVLCRLGKQSWFEVMGRDPVKSPMTIMESALLTACIIELYNHEQKKDATEDSSGDDEPSVIESPRLSQQQKVA